MESGNSMIWKQIDANTYERKTALNGKPSVIPGMAKQIDGHTMETATTRGDVTAVTARIVLSDGGKVMTVTNTPAGSGSSREPSVVVFTKR